MGNGLAEIRCFALEPPISSMPRRLRCLGVVGVLRSQPRARRYSGMSQGCGEVLLGLNLHGDVKLSKMFFGVTVGSGLLPISRAILPIRFPFESEYDGV